MKNAIGLVVFGKYCGEADPLVMSYLNAANQECIDISIFSDSEIDRYQRHGYIYAYSLQNNKLEKVKTDFPYYVELFSFTASALANHGDRINWLKANTKSVDGNGINKYNLQSLLMQSALYSYSIPTYKVSSYPELCALLNLIPEAILKPVGGSEGFGVLRLSTCSQSTTYVSRTDRGVLTAEFFEEYQKQLLNKKAGYIIVQPCINICDDDGKAVDFRVLLSLNEHGEWSVVNTIAKVGSNSVVSNVGSGGVLTQPDFVIEKMAPGHGKEKCLEMEQVSLEVARLISSTVNAPISCFGIDICMERDSLQLYVIEANTKPGTLWCADAIGAARAKYYKFVLSVGAK